MEELEEEGGDGAKNVEIGLKLDFGNGVREGEEEAEEDEERVMVLGDDG